MTELLIAWGRGDQHALDQLAPVVYDELKRLARRHLANERPDHTLQPTALVNEVYLKLVGVTRMKWQNRAHFFAMSARLMRRVLVDFARSRRYQKRGGAARRVSLDEGLLVANPEVDLVELDDALKQLAELDVRRSQVVEMRFFGGLSVKETAEALGISEDTVTRDWKLARAWLQRELSRPPGTREVT